MHRFHLLGLSLFVSACAHTGYPPASDPSSASGPPSEAHAGHDKHDEHEDDNVPNDATTRAKSARVAVMQTDDGACETEVLGLVDIHKKMESTEQALDLLRRKAVVLGGEKVIGVEFHHGEGGEEPTHLSGMAVRCNALLRGRPYDVLGKIDIPGGTGDEDEALHQLRAKASAMRADLIIGVSFEHGEGEGQPSHISGTAIRLRRSSADTN
jgi:uncharacterized protein YbjQ (UPF0145 family)